MFLNSYKKAQPKKNTFGWDEKRDGQKGENLTSDGALADPYFQFTRRAPQTPTVSLAPLDVIVSEYVMWTW